MVQVIIFNNIINVIADLIFDILVNLAASLVWAAVAFVAVYFYNKFSTWFYRKKFYKSTRLVIDSPKDKLIINCYIANSGRYDENEKVYLGYPFEYMASASINSYLSLVINKLDMSTFSSPLDIIETKDINKTGDLILLGGPFHNSLTRLFFGLTKENTNIPFYFDTFEGEEATLFYKNYDDVEYKKVKPIKDPIGNYYCEDYGLIINIRNPYDSSKRIISLMGCRSIGVLGATLAFTKFNKKIMSDVNPVLKISGIVAGSQKKILK